MHTAELLVLEPSPFEVETGPEKLDRYKLPGIDHILAEMIHTSPYRFGGDGV
jgi:hypothetical protein